MTGEEYGDLFRDACDLFENNEYDKAEEICNRLIEVNDKQAPIFNLLALIKDKKGELDLAIKNSEIAVFLKKDDYIYYSNLGDFLRKKGELSKSLYILEKSVELNPNFHISNFNLGNVHRVLKNNGEAQKYFEKAIELKPDYVEALNNLGLLYMENHNFKFAETIYLLALNYTQNDIDIFFNLALSYVYTRRNEQAEYYFKKVIEKNKSHVRAHRLLGNILIEQGKVEEAKSIYNTYLKLIQNDNEIVNVVENMYVSMIPNFPFNNNKEIDDYRDLLFRLADNKYPVNNLEFIYESSNAHLSIGAFHSYLGRDNKDLKIKYASMFEKNFPNYNPLLGKGKIKIGFLLTTFNENVFAKFMVSIINNLSNDIFDIYLICDSVGWNSIIKNKITNNINLISLSDNLLKSSEIIKNEHLDIIYYWEVGTDSTNYFLSFFRLAPIQCTSIGWPDTTGIKTIDYFISSELIEIETAQEHYSEKLIKLKKLPLYFKKPIIKDYKTLDTFGLNNNFNLYFYCHNIAKIHPDFDYIISNILDKDSKALIIFYRPNNANEGIYKKLKSRLEKKFKELFSRIKFLDNLSLQEYLSLIKDSSVILDSLYFGGISTCYDCFAMETPVVTYPWTHARGRYTLGCYKQMGIEGLIANSLDDYIDLAIKVANDKEFRNKIVTDIKENNHKLFEDKDLFEEYNNIFKNLVNR